MSVTASPGVSLAFTPTVAVPRLAQCAVVLAALLIIWNSLGDHALYPPDEGRYGSVSAWMAETGRWLEPEIRGEPHLTKPPFAYWAQAAAISVFGRTEFALRLPSALAGTAAVLSMFWFFRRTSGPLTAVLAVGVYSVMPLPAVVSRLATTDSLLNLWWWLALCFGYLAITRARVGWTIAFWAAVALVGLTKGPLIFAPVVLIGAWLLLAGRGRDIRALHPWFGLPLALAPLAAVIYFYWNASTNHEGTAALWRSEFVDRLLGTGRSGDPVWEFIPVLLVGLFPASAFMVLPWLNTTWRSAWACATAGDLRALMLISVVLPFIGFSLLSGKQHTYLLPLAAPMAFLGALTLQRWLEATQPKALPNPRVLCTIAMCTAAVGVPAVILIAERTGHLPAAFPARTLLLWSLPLAAAAIGWCVCSALWANASRRLAAMACAFGGMVAMWAGFAEVEDAALNAVGTRTFAEHLAATGRPVLAHTLRDLTIDFYMHRWTEFTYSTQRMYRWLSDHPDGLVVITQRDLERANAENPDMMARLHLYTRVTLWPAREIVVLERGWRPEPEEARFWEAPELAP